METSSYDRLAVQIPKYGAVLTQLPRQVKEQAFDIHLKAGQPLAVCGSEGVFFLKEDGGVTRALTEGLLRVTREELQEVFLQACSQSVFSHEQELCRGYLLLNGSCRAGVCGTAVCDTASPGSERIKTVRDVTSLVFRIPREIRGCGDRLFLEGVEFSRGVLIAGEPSSGKTTLLRDIAFSLSVGKFQPIRRVAVLDRRGEIAGGFDLGPCADVLTGYPIGPAFETAVRMLSPEFLLCDELSPGDLEAVRQSVLSGAGLIASVHGNREDLFRRPLCRALLETGAFGTVVYLAGRSRPGEIEAIERTEDGDEAAGNAADPGQRPASRPAQRL